MFFKKYRRTKAAGAGSETSELFYTTLEKVESIRQYTEHRNNSTISDTIAVYDFAIRAIAKDMAADSACQLFRGTHCPYSRDYLIPFLLHGEVKNIEFGRNEVIAPVWSIDRWSGAVSTVMQSGFRQSFDNYTGYLYKELNLIIITNGLHHTSIASLMNTGSATLSVVHLSDYFRRLQVDGTRWFYATETGTLTAPVRDYRSAVLYELAKRRAKIAGKAELVLPEDEDIPHEQDKLYDQLLSAQNKVRYWKKECELLNAKLDMSQQENN